MIEDTCPSSRKLLEKDEIFVRNLYGTDYRQTPDLPCIVQGEHHTHVSAVITQWFGDDLLGWWASWRNADSIWEDYSLFQGPFCPELGPEDTVCISVKGHQGEHLFS